MLNIVMEMMEKIEEVIAMTWNLGMQGIGIRAMKTISPKHFSYSVFFDFIILCKRINDIIPQTQPNSMDDFETLLDATFPIWRKVS